MKILIATVLIVAALAHGTVGASESPAERSDFHLGAIVHAALEQSRTVEQAALRTRLALIERDAVLDAQRAAWTVATEPAYGLVTRRAADFSSLTNVTEFPPEPRTTFTHSVGLGASVRQPLPTSGVISAGLSGRFQATVSQDDEDGSTTVYSLQPELRVSVAQPLFVDGRLIDTERAALILENADSAIHDADAGERALAERLVGAVIRLYAQLDSLQRTIALQQTEMELTRLRIDDAEIRLERGQGTRQTVLSLRVQMNRLVDAELRTTIAAEEVAIELSRLTGLDVRAASALAPISAVLDPNASAGPAEAAARPVETPALETAQIAVVRAETAAALARKSERANASIALAVTPRYADERASADRPAGAVSDYSGDGSGFDWRVSLDVTVPLGREPARRRDSERASIALEIARLDLAERESESRSGIELARRRIDILDQRIELAELDLVFDREQLAAERELVEIGATTDLKIATLSAQIAARESEIVDLTTERALETIELHRLRGTSLVELVSGTAATGERQR